jgi:hypothetical protein
MKKWNGGTKCPDGFYFNTTMWEFVQVRDGKPSVLPGESDVVFYKVPAGTTLIAGPLFGLMFAIFLPLFGILAFVGYSIYKLVRARRSLKSVKAGHHK